MTDEPKAGSEIEKRWEPCGCEDYLALRAELAAIKEEIARLRKQNHDSAAKEHARADAAEKELRHLKHDIQRAREFYEKQPPDGARVSKFLEQMVAGFLHGECILEAEADENWRQVLEMKARAEQAEARVKALEDLVSGRITYGQYDKWEAHLWDEARAILAARKSGGGDV